MISDQEEDFNIIIAVSGRKITLPDFPTLQCFIHKKSSPDDYFSISEITTGFRICATCKTEEEAIGLMLYKIQENGGIKAFEEIVNNVKKSYPLSLKSLDNSNRKFWAD